MAGWGARFVLVLVVFCIVASVCEARGGRGGGGSRGGRYSSRSRYRYRGGSSGSSSSSGGSADAGMIVGIIFGVIGGVIFLVVIIVVCKAFCCNSSSGGAAKYNSSSGVVRTITNTTATTRQPYNAYDNAAKASYNHDATNGVQPPSYDSAVNEKDGALPYSSQPNGDPAYPPPASSYPAYPGSPPEAGYSANASGLSYAPTPAGPGYGFSGDGAYGAAYTADQGNGGPSAPSNV